MAVLRTRTLNGTTCTIEYSLPMAHTITLALDQWVGGDGIYSQVVAVRGDSCPNQDRFSANRYPLASFYEKFYGLRGIKKGRDNPVLRFGPELGICPCGWQKQQILHRVNCRPAFLQRFTINALSE